MHCLCTSLFPRNVTLYHTGEATSDVMIMSGGGVKQLVAQSYASSDANINLVFLPLQGLSMIASAQQLHALSTLVQEGVSWEACRGSAAGLVVHRWPCPSRYRPGVLCVACDSTRLEDVAELERGHAAPLRCFEANPHKKLQLGLLIMSQTIVSFSMILMVLTLYHVVVLAILAALWLDCLSECGDI
eukprot:2564266-Amphidinium_carterae.2